MKCLSLLAAIIFSIVISSCGQEQHSELLSLNATSEWRKYLDDQLPFCMGQPSKENCDDGDMTLFNGLSCASGDSRGCYAVEVSQSSDGRWWRSPRRLGGNNGEDNSFSRDMAMGVMLYLVTRRDAESANRWLNWIEGNRPCLADKPWPLEGCAVRGPHRYCTDEVDQRCTLTPSSWALLGRVWDYLGIRRNAEMRRYEGADGDALVFAAEQNDAGYTLHLVGVEVLLKQIMQAGREHREKAATNLAHRQPENIFFRWLNEGAHSKLATELQKLCPSPSQPHRGKKYQWAWERDTDSAAWRNSMIWDCLFMLNILKIN